MSQPVTPPDITALRAEFPGATSQLYFDTASRGLIPLAAKARILAEVEDRVEGSADKAAMFACVESVRARFAALHGVGADDVAMTKNISDGLNMIAWAFPWEAGDNVVVCAEREHPNNVYPWYHLARLRGIELRLVPPEGERIGARPVVAAMDSRTRMVSASSVSFMPGLRSDLEGIGAACRARGALFLVDAAQSAGVLALDLARLPVDAMACSAQKGLLGLYGLGLLYVAPDWAERLVPAYMARFGVDLGDAHEADIGSADYRLMPGARRFDLGNYNFTAAAGLDAVLEMMARIGPQAIEAQATGVARRLAQGALSAGLAVAGDPEGAEFAHIVTIRGSEARIAALAAHLEAQRCRFSLRRGALRLSCHVYNSLEDVLQVTELLCEAAATAPA